MKYNIHYFFGPRGETVIPDTRNPVDADDLAEMLEAMIGNLRSVPARSLVISGVQVRAIEPGA